MTKDPKLLPQDLFPFVAAAERRHGVTLLQADYQFIAAAVADFVAQAIDKFVAGAVEHAEPDSQGFVASVDHNREMGNEIVDMWMYHKGNICKKKST